MRGATRIRQILEDGKDKAFLSRDLATVKRDVPIEIGFAGAPIYRFQSGKNPHPVYRIGIYQPASSSSKTAANSAASSGKIRLSSAWL